MPFPIVGSHYHPPAKAILDSIPPGTQLILQPEPENSYDSNAIKVIIASKDIPENSHLFLSDQLMAYGLEIEDILNQEIWHLGYLPRAVAQNLTIDKNTIVYGIFSIDHNGRYLVSI